MKNIYNLSLPVIKYSIDTLKYLLISKSNFKFGSRLPFSYKTMLREKYLNQVLLFVDLTSFFYKKSIKNTKFRKRICKTQS